MVIKCCGYVQANNEEVGDSGSLVKKSSIINSEPAFKRPRIQTPSPLPTFKVRIKFDKSFD